MVYCKRGETVERTISTDATKRLLTDSLKKLMAQKPLDKITIREITDGCGVNRQTFYYHFEDIYDQLRWMYRQEAIELLAQHRGVLIWQDGLLQLFRYLEKNKAICLCTLRSSGSETLRHFLWTDIHDIIHRAVEDMSQAVHATPETQTMLTDFYVSLLAGVTSSWLLGELPYTPEQVVSAAGCIIQDHRAGMLLRYQQSPSQHGSL